MFRSVFPDSFTGNPGSQSSKCFGPAHLPFDPDPAQPRLPPAVLLPRSLSLSSLETPPPSCQTLAARRQAPALSLSADQGVGASDRRRRRPLQQIPVASPASNPRSPPPPATPVRRCRLSRRAGGQDSGAMKPPTGQAATSSASKRPLFPERSASPAVNISTLPPTLTPGTSET
jgi:hypothetical protein